MRSEGLGGSEEAKNIELVLSDFGVTLKQQMDINMKKASSNYQDEWQQGRISIDEVRFVFDIQPSYLVSHAFIYINVIINMHRIYLTSQLLYRFE